MILLRARFPFLYFPTWEEERFIRVIESVVSNVERIKTPRKVYQWSITKGMTPLPASEDMIPFFNVYR